MFEVNKTYRSRHTANQFFKCLYAGKEYSFFERVSKEGVYMGRNYMYANDSFDLNYEEFIPKQTWYCNSFPTGRMYCYLSAAEADNHSTFAKAVSKRVIVEV